MTNLPTKLRDIKRRLETYDLWSDLDLITLEQAADEIERLQGLPILGTIKDGKVNWREP